MSPSHDRAVPLAARVNALSLDAPAVAVVWQAVFVVACLQRWPRWPEAAALGLTVWLIYVGDRLLDARRLDTRRPHLYRHRLHADHARTLAAAWLVGLGLAVAVVVGRLGAGLTRCGLLVALLVLLYGVSVHVVPRPLQRVPKEWKVGLIFAIGVSLPCWAEAAGVPLLVSTLLAGSLFTANCLIVSHREAAAEPEGAASAGGIVRRLPVLVLAGAGVGAAAGLVQPVLAAALLAGASTLLWLAPGADAEPAPLRAVDGSGRTRVDPAALRVDAALVVPPALAAIAVAALVAHRAGA